MLQIITFQQKDSFVSLRSGVHSAPSSVILRFWKARHFPYRINMLTAAHLDRPTLHCLMAFVKDYVVQTGFLA